MLQFSNRGQLHKETVLKVKADYQLTHANNALATVPRLKTVVYKSCARPYNKCSNILTKGMFLFAEFCSYIKRGGT